MRTSRGKRHSWKASPSFNQVLETSINMWHPRAMPKTTAQTIPSQAGSLLEFRAFPFPVKSVSDSRLGHLKSQSFRQFRSSPYSPFSSIFSSSTVAFQVLSLIQQTLQPLSSPATTQQGCLAVPTLAQHTFFYQHPEGRWEQEKDSAGDIYTKLSKVPANPGPAPCRGWIRCCKRLGPPSCQWHPASPHRCVLRPYSTF